MGSKLINFWMSKQDAVVHQTKLEQGASLVYMALMLPFMISLAALMIDGSNFYREQLQIQTATDAAALAGARLLALGSSTTQIQSEVQTLATTNGANSITWSYLTGNTGLQVTASHTYSTFFASMIGYRTLTVKASASANFFAIASSSNLLPMTVRCDNFQLDQVYTLWGKDLNSSGSFGWLDWTGPPVGSSELANNIANIGTSGVWHVGDWVPTGPGVQNTSSVKEALNLWINKPVTIPLFNTMTGTGQNTRYQICTFGQFTLLAYDFSGSNKWVQGKFIRTMKHAGSHNSTARDFGVRDVQIVH